VQFLQLDPEPVVAAPRNPAKHHLMGNSMLSTFDGGIRHDQSWRAVLTPAHQATIRELTEPLFSRYGYQ
jgi:hypothetical protein